MTWGPSGTRGGMHAQSAHRAPLADVGGKQHGRLVGTGPIGPHRFCQAQLDCDLGRVSDFAQADQVTTAMCGCSLVVVVTLAPRYGTDGGAWPRARESGLP
jgi:hypothetical protein